MTYGPRELVETKDGWVQRAAPEQSSASAEDEYLASLEAGIADCLTPRQRFVMECRAGVHDGVVYTQREIADMMGVNRGVVARHEERARKKLERWAAKTGSLARFSGE